MRADWHRTAPAAPYGGIRLKALRETGYLCCSDWKRLSTIDIRLVDAGELLKERGELCVHHWSHQRLEGFNHIAIGPRPHRADFNDFHLAGRQAITFVAGRFDVDDEDT